MLTRFRNDEQNRNPFGHIEKLERLVQYLPLEDVALGSRYAHPHQLRATPGDCRMTVVGDDLKIIGKVRMKAPLQLRMLTPRRHASTSARLERCRRRRQPPELRARQLDYYRMRRMQLRAGMLNVDSWRPGLRRHQAELLATTDLDLLCLT